MKRLLLSVLAFALAASLNAQDMPTISEVFNYNIGDEFHRTASWEYPESSTTPNAYRFVVSGKYYSQNQDTVFYIRNNFNYTTELISNPEPHLEYTFENFFDTVFYTDLDALISSYDEGFLHDSATVFFSDICDTLTIGYTYELGEKWESLTNEYGKGVGLARYYNHVHDAEDIIDEFQLVYFKKGDIECGEPDNTAENISEIKSIQDLITVYPNPSNDIVNITSLQTEINAFTVRDLQGKLLIEKAVEARSSSIDMKDFSSGIYILEIITNNESIKKRIIRR